MTSALSERLVRCLPPGDRDARLAALHDAPPVRELTRSRTTDTALVDVPGLGRAVRKRWRWPGLGERLKGVGRTTLLARTPAEREWAALERLYGSPPVRFHPAPLAFRVERVGGLATRAMLLLEEIVDAVDLALLLRDERSPTRRRAVLCDLARRTRAMHADGVSDGDLHARNLLVAPGDTRVWNVDCARQRRHAAPLSGRRADHDLACVDVCLARFATRSERLRALREYLDVGPRAPETRRRARAIVALRRRIDAEESRRLPGPGPQ